MFGVQQGFTRVNRCSYTHSSALYCFGSGEMKYASEGCTLHGITGKSRSERKAPGFRRGLPQHNATILPTFHTSLLLALAPTSAWSVSCEPSRGALERVLEAGLEPARPLRAIRLKRIVSAIPPFERNATERHRLPAWATVRDLELSQLMNHISFWFRPSRLCCVNIISNLQHPRSS